MVNNQMIQQTGLYSEEELSKYIESLPEDLNITLSASSYKQYLACPRSFLFHKILKPEPTHPDYHWGWFGSMVHNCIYYAIANIDAEGNWIPTYSVKNFEDVYNFYNNYWSKNFSENEQLNILRSIEKLDEEEFEFFARGNVEAEKEKTYTLGLDLIKSGIRLIEKLYSLDIKNIKIEQKINQKIYNFDVIGYVDIQFEYKGKLFFLDFKTSKVPLKDDLLQEDIQFFLYSFILKNMYNLDYYPNGYLVHLRSSTAFNFRLLWQNMETSLSKIQMLEKNILQKNFMQNFSPLCRYCKYRGYCKIK